MGSSFSALPSDKHSQRKSRVSEEMCSFVDFDIPEDLLVEILSFVPANDLINYCCLVCHHWNDIISRHGIWRRKCQRGGRVIPNYRFEKIPRNYFRNIFLGDPYGRNLLKNPYGKEKLQHWTVVRNDGEGWIIEEPPLGADPVPEKAGSQSCFATSYGDCIKFQVIDLIKNGVNEEILDEVGPDIRVGEWHASRFDCGSLYNLKVVLFNASKCEIDTFDYGPFREEQWVGRAWKEVEYIFSGYPPGVRYIMFEHYGTDTQFWAGHYGSKMTGGYVKFGSN